MKKNRQRRHKKRISIKRIDTETQSRINTELQELKEALNKAYKKQKERARDTAGEQANLKEF